MKRILALLFFLILNSVGCKKTGHQKRLRCVIERSLASILNESKSFKSNTPDTCVTIWIHGSTLGLAPLFPSFFYCPKGLSLAKNLDTRYHMRTISDTLHIAAPDLFPQNSFYLFGWSGALSAEARDQAAYKLAKEINNLFTAYTKRNLTPPKLRIICHSHGGNVALLLGKYKDILPPHCTINELILLGCPIQKISALYATSPIFEKIYNFYSTIDTVQIIDPQRLTAECTEPTPFFSERCFSPNKKIIQVQLKWNGRGIMHIEFILARFLRLLPFIMKKSLEWYAKEGTELNQRLLHLKFSD